MNARPLYGLALILTMVGCKPKADTRVVVEEEVLPQRHVNSTAKSKLSEYGFFSGLLRHLEPVKGVVPYTLNSPLFSDYAFKKRFVQLPVGRKVQYNADDVFDFPEGTTLIKNFYYPADFRKPDKDIRILETRLLIREKEGWKTLPYVWNDEQTEGYLDVSGSSKPVSWIHHDGLTREVNYTIPNTNQCKACHLRGDRLVPIGPSARQLNGDYLYAVGKKNQLVYWSENNMLEGLPSDGKWPRLPSYDNPKEAIDARARAWLEVNCAHCHRADGPARNSGLHLLANVTNPVEFGLGKAPVAAGKGTGGRLFGIVPGKPDESILQYRIESTDPGIMMPEIGRKLRHEEGIKLVSVWISELK